MTFLRWGWLAVTIALPLGAGTVVDVSTRTTQVLNPGGALLFSFSASNFIADAGLFGLPAYPTLVRFTFVSAEVNGAGEFSAGLSTADGGFAIPFLGPLSFAPATFQSAQYDGPVSAIAGSLALTADVSQQFFAGGRSAILTLRNEGPAVTVGLPGYTLIQDFYGTLAGNGLSVGAWATSTGYLDPPPVPELSAGALFGATSADYLDPPAAPEPSPGVLFLSGGALLCALSAGLKRMGRRAHLKN